MKPPWYAFNWPTVILTSALLILFFATTDWPHGLMDWLMIPLELLAGNALYAWLRR